MPYPLPSADIEAKLANLDTAYTICTRTLCAEDSRGGKRPSFIRIGLGTNPNRVGVLIAGGVHAREWASPDALLSFAEELLKAEKAKRNMSFPAFTHTRPAAGGTFSYGAYTISKTDVAKWVDRLDIYIIPCVNPDGRDFSLLPGNKMWRKNRWPHPVDPTCSGVDLNRNFPIAWDQDVFYSVAGAANVATCTNACDPAGQAVRDTFRGTGSTSEPETRNLIAVMGISGIKYYLDVHAYGPTILFPWGIEQNQSTTSGKWFNNHDWDRPGPHGGRDGTAGVTYAEWIPDSGANRLLKSHQDLGKAMKAEIIKAAGASAAAVGISTYNVEQSLSLYPTTGASDDYFMSTQFPPPAGDGKHAFTIEIGSALDGEYFPGPAQFRKYERDIHGALCGALRVIASRVQPAPSSDWCAIATAAYGSPEHERVRLLQRLRLEVLRSTPFGRRFTGALEAGYYSFSPKLAAWLWRHRRLRALVRVGIVTPAVLLLERVMALLGRLPSRRLRVVLLAAVITLLVAVPVGFAGAAVAAAAWALWPGR
jgi:Zinc carboxypeptidase